MNLLNILLEEPEARPERPKQPTDGVYYIPALLTNIQQDLLELVVEIFRSELLDLYNAKRQRTSIDSLLDNSKSTGSTHVGTTGGANGTTGSNTDAGNVVINGASLGASFSTGAKINLLYEQLCLIDRHPTLLVDHFIPRKLILMDVNERMENMLGKFHLFNRLVDLLLERYPKKLSQTRDVENDGNSNRKTNGIDSDSYPGYFPRGQGYPGAKTGGYGNRNDSGVSLKSRFTMLVVAQSVKELELIEGLIIGKKLYYKNISSGKLYDDGTGFPKSESDTPDQGSRAETPQTNLGGKQEATKNGKRTIHDHHNNDQMKKRPKTSCHKHYSYRNNTVIISNEQANENLCIYLATSQLVYNYTFDENIDMIFLFDSELDLKNPGIEFIRSNYSGQSLLDQQLLKVPILMPISALSVEHCAQKIKQTPDSELNYNFYGNSDSDGSELSSRHKWILKIVNMFIANRRQLFSKEYNDEDFFMSVFLTSPGVFAQWAHSWTEMQSPLPENYDDFIGKHLQVELKTNSSDATIKRELQTNYFYDFGPRSNQHAPDGKIESESNNIALSQNIDYKTYKEQVAAIIHDRIQNINDSIDHKYKTTLTALREQEHNQQLRIDEDTERIGTKYRELTSANEKAAVAERKLAKAELDYDKFKNQEQELVAKLEYLDENLEIFKNKHANGQENDLDLIINQQIHYLDNLREELDSVDKALGKLIKEEDQLRVDYQEGSSEAVRLLEKLDRLTGINQKLETKLNGPGARLLPTLSRDYELLNHKAELTALKGTNKFMDDLLSTRLNKIVTERTAAVENSGSVSSSRGSRMSRATTPF